MIFSVSTPLNVISYRIENVKCRATARMIIFSFLGGRISNRITVLLVIQLLDYKISLRLKQLLLFLFLLCVFYCDPFTSGYVFWTIVLKHLFNSGLVISVKILVCKVSVKKLWVFVEVNPENQHEITIDQFDVYKIYIVLTIVMFLFNF